MLILKERLVGEDTYLVYRYSGVVPCMEYAPEKVVNTKIYHSDLSTYGTAYWRTVLATRPAHEFKTLVKWSLESIECVGSVQ